MRVGVREAGGDGSSEDRTRGRMHPPRGDMFIAAAEHLSDKTGRDRGVPLRLGVEEVGTCVLLTVNALKRTAIN